MDIRKGLKNKKSVSPVVATVLLVAIVIVLAVIVFLWARGFVGESITKKGRPVDQVCDDISLDIQYSSSDGRLQITNTGNIPVFRLEVQKKTGGTETRDSIDQRIYVGSSIEASINSGVYDWIKIYPAVYAEGEKGKVAYTCKIFMQPS